MDSQTIDRGLGALVGLAVGDALGTTLEFTRRDSRAPHTEMTGGGPFNLQPGEWTDDTAMALALAESLLAHREFDAGDLARRFLNWWHLGIYSCTGTCFDIGITTQQALARFERTANPLSGSVSEDAAGNGSIMRLAPVALSCWNDAERAIEVARQQSRVTHGAPQALDACEILAGLLVEAINGRVAQPAIRGEAHRELQSVLQGDFRSKPRAEITSSGYVVSTLEAALWAVEQTATFEEALILAVNLGDDSDSVGAVTGQIAGATYGLSSIPPRWLANLAWRDRIEAIGLRLLG